ncbi:hypothetical protein PHJA_002767800 [Phtheirospermum japonicum]|uniref:Uncharacterized protein n=1 Tax=Phtheirospermum japonicum TaxID=374723 RepID=A0A830D0S6_9LAMI|nr:hypothetical protein PHJA_002767800 [Phtheirospermum japonicum]
MGLTNKTKIGIENLSIKRREPVQHRAILPVEDRLEALETRVDNLVQELMQMNARFENFKAESRMRFEGLEQGQARLLEITGRIEQWHISQGHYPPPPPYNNGS